MLNTNLPVTSRLSISMFTYLHQVILLALVGVGQYPLADLFRVDGIGKGQGMLRKCLLSAGGMV